MECWVCGFETLNKQPHSALGLTASWYCDSHKKKMATSKRHTPPHICTHIIFYPSALSPSVSWQLRAKFCWTTHAHQNGTYENQSISCHRADYFNNPHLCNWHHRYILSFTAHILCGLPSDSPPAALLVSSVLSVSEWEGQEWYQLLKLLIAHTDRLPSQQKRSSSVHVW